MMKGTRLARPVAISVLAISLGSCSAMQGRETASEYVDDATITTKVKAAILEDPTLKLSQINVETFQDVVQLSGFVDTSMDATKAQQIASSIKGVRQVKNDIVVR